MASPESPAPSVKRVVFAAYRRHWKALVLGLGALALGQLGGGAIQHRPLLEEVVNDRAVGLEVAIAPGRGETMQGRLLLGEQHHVLAALAQVRAFAHVLTLHEAVAPGREALVGDAEDLLDAVIDLFAAHRVEVHAQPAIQRARSLLGDLGQDFAEPLIFLGHAFLEDLVAGQLVRVEGRLARHQLVHDDDQSTLWPGTSDYMLNT